MTVPFALDVSADGDADRLSSPSAIDGGALATRRGARDISVAVADA